MQETPETWNRVWRYFLTAKGCTPGSFVVFSWLSSWVHIHIALSVSPVSPPGPYQGISQNEGIPAEVPLQKISEHICWWWGTLVINTAVHSLLCGQQCGSWGGVSTKWTCVTLHQGPLHGCICWSVCGMCVCVQMGACAPRTVLGRGSMASSRFSEESLTLQRLSTIDSYCLQQWDFAERWMKKLENSDLELGCQLNYSGSSLRLWCISQTLHFRKRQNILFVSGCLFLFWKSILYVHLQLER